MTELSKQNKILTFEEYLEYKRTEEYEEECSRRKQGELVFGNVTHKELWELYNKWDYEYKPSFDVFSDVFGRLGIKGFDFLGFLEDARHRAYYSHTHPTTDYGFEDLSCLIYLAMAKGMETPYDHVLKSDKDFEYKLNCLDKKD